MSAQPADGNEFEVTVTVTDAGTVVAVLGEVDVVSASGLRETLTSVQGRLHRRAASLPVVVDLSGVTFMDASGLGVLVGAARRAHQGGRDIVLRDPSARTLRVLQISRLLHIFRVEWHEADSALLADDDDVDVAPCRNAA
jgi:anti-sigma B factor antagonist